MTDERLPPIDLMAEAKVLAAILEDENVFDEVADKLKSDHFYGDANRQIFAAMEAIRREDNEVTLPAVVDWLRDQGKLQRVGGVEYIDGELYQKTPSVIDPSKDADRIVDRWTARQFILSAKESVAKATISSVGDNAEIIARHMNEVSALIESTAGTPEMSMREAVGVYAKRFQEEIQRRQQLEAEGKSIIEIPTGIVGLDKLMAGLHRGNLTVIAGRPGMGKSAAGYMLGTHCAGRESYSGKTMAAAFMSLEMPMDQLVMRAACMESRVSITPVRERKLNPNDSSRYFAALGEVAKLPIYIADQVTDLEELLARIRRLKIRSDKDGYELTTVIIDYLQLITTTQNKNQTRENVVGQISRRMKSAAKSLDVSMVLLAQLNRECEATADKRPRLHHLRESGSIEQDADDVIFLFRNDYYREKAARSKKQKERTNGAYIGDDDDEEFTPDNIIEIDLAKQRNGPTGVIKCRWTPHCTRIDNLADETDPEWE